MTTRYIPAPFGSRHSNWSMPRVSWRVAALGMLAGLTIMGVAAGIARLLVGMGATTSLTDVYPWGIWIGFDFSLIAFAGVGFTMAAVVHVLHLHRFENALRPSLFAGFLGYVAVLVILLLDLGRPDRFYSFLINWNLHSPLFEICWCVLLYSTVLTIEVSPEVFGFLGWERFKRWSLAIMSVVCIIGITLSTLHQSTLGTLYVNMPYRLDELWYTTYLPGLFFLSSVMAGLSIATLSYRGAACIHRRCADLDIPAGLAWGIVGAIIAYLALRFGVLAMEGKLAATLSGTVQAQAFWFELTIGCFLPLVLFIVGWIRRMDWIYWVAPALVAIGVAMNRFNATLIGQSPPWAGSYSPHVMEWLTTAGILSGAFLVWLLAVRYLVHFDDAAEHH